MPAPLRFAAERAIGALLRGDPDARARLARIEGRVVRIVVGAAPASAAFELAIAVVDGRVDVLGAFDGDADVTIMGSLAALRSLSRSNDALYSGEVRVEGDIAVAQGLSELIGGLDVDLEEIVAPLIGGTLARRVGIAGRDAGEWFGRTRSSFRANVEEYLKEEAELLPTREEVERWAGDVDELRASVDRLEARVARLERRRAASAAGGEGGDSGSTAANAAGSVGADGR